MDEQQERQTQGVDGPGDAQLTSPADLLGRAERPARSWRPGPGMTMAT